MRPSPAVVTCEHASDRVPAPLAHAFRGAGRALASHRGHDLGAAPLARAMARALDAPLHLGRVSRMVVDLNRSLGHPRLFSEWSRSLEAAERDALVERYWRPYREAVEADVRSRTGSGLPVLHLSVHSFTPRLDGRTRDFDVGILYDPSRPGERALAQRWSRALRTADPRLRVRRNAPYRGDADGLTTSLRRVFPDADYLGIELEVSQRLPRAGGSAWRDLQALLVRTLRASISPGSDRELAGGARAQ